VSGSITDTGAKDHTDTIPVVIRDGQTGVLQGFTRSDQRKMGEAVHLSRRTATKHLDGIEPFHLGCYLDFFFRRIVMTYSGCARNAVQNILPGRFHIVSQRADTTQTCNDDSFFYQIKPPIRKRARANLPFKHNHPLMDALLPV
jgi:hypothetical protein